MKTLFLESKELLPGILLDRESEKFQIFGISCPMDAFEFYEPVFEWFDEYIENPLKKTNLDINLSYFNTVSAKFLLRIMTKLSKLSEAGHYVNVNWYYSEDDENMKEEGEEFENILNMNFELIPVKIETKKKSKKDDFFEQMMDDLFES